VSALQANLALVYIERSEWAEAESLLSEALAADRRIHGEDHRNVAIRLHHLGTVYRGQGRLAEADSVLQLAIRTARGSLGDSHLLLAHFLANQPRVHLARGDAAAAEAAAREAAEIFRVALPAEDWRTAEADGLLGQALAARGLTDEAEQLLLQSHAALERRWGTDDRRTREAWARLAEYFQATPAAAEATGPPQALRELD
jgi:tetratricopeptide (TPR) repeat protein